jgi:hypothetical protein
MTIQTINIGNVVNDGLGDDLRTAFQKVNANFTDLYSSLTPTMSNVGSTGAGIFKEKAGNEFKLKRLVAGNKMFINELTDSIIFTNNQPGAFETITTNSGIMDADNYPNISIVGGNDITTFVQGDAVKINTVLPVTDILSNMDFGPISGSYTNIIQLYAQSSNLDFGTVSNPSSLTIDLGEL